MKSENCFTYDTQYWWHNIPLILPEWERFCYLLNPGTPPLAEYILPYIAPHLGSKVLELGSGTGWLRDAWHLRGYVGIEQNSFSLDFQSFQKARAKANGVVCRSIETLDGIESDFDTLICFESFHAFSESAIRQADSMMLRPGGALIIVDGVSWWSRSTFLDSSSLELKYRSTIPVELFDFEKMAHLTLDLISALESRGVARTRIIESARGFIQPELFKGLQVGIPVDRIRDSILRRDVAPKGFQYDVIVLTKR